MAQARPKIRAILRTRPHYSVAELITQFKTHIWGIMEVHNGGIVHASNHLMNRFDDSQRHFLGRLGVDERYEFIEHNFPSPSTPKYWRSGFATQTCFGKQSPDLPALATVSRGCVRIAPPS